MPALTLMLTVDEANQTAARYWLFGPRTFTSEIHHQDLARYLIVETNAGKPGVVDEWTISAAIPVADLIK